MGDDSGIDTTVAPSGTGCAECEAANAWWVHLRRCAACGHIGCCDTSPSQHATAHFAETGHPLMQSFEPGEDWFWDYRTEEAIDGPVLAAPDTTRWTSRRLVPAVGCRRTGRNSFTDGGEGSSAGGREVLVVGR